MRRIGRIGAHVVARSSSVFPCRRTAQTLPDAAVTWIRGPFHILNGRKSAVRSSRRRRSSLKMVTPLFAPLIRPTEGGHVTVCRRQLPAKTGRLYPCPR